MPSSIYWWEFKAKSLDQTWGISSEITPSQTEKPNSIFKQFSIIIVHTPLSVIFKESYNELLNFFRQ